ncbi:hypothetical protein HYH02_007399 [Chlamydomonas schloesseri]|uniref:Peptidase M11 gametolysin domain-containing protein n=1 Tax=Chlamydomonas schloesseri TaxID=2026947 RepID=A0A836B4I2_9CHLO|nr:hypothetical protein HYH02_007399 [Chlamydomonas schloesseri]|eukprot:KAG2447471.1 hypothetical protein HYH02_007399 [Chlamydomonas schloesseri]
MTGEMAGEEDGDADPTSTDVIYLLQVHEPAFSLFELRIPHSLLHSPLGSGDPVMVTGYRQGEDAIAVVSIVSKMATFSSGSGGGVAGRHRLMMEYGDPDAALAAAAAAVAAAAADAAAAVVAAATRPRGLQAGGPQADGPTGAARAAAAAAVLSNTRVVRDMPVLYMVVGMCGFGPSISVADLESVLFAGPNNRGPTVEAYYAECSRGKTAMNRGNSLVVGPLQLPCAFNSTAYRFSTSTCTYRDYWGWHTWAQQYAASALGVDLARYRHRVLVMPRGFMYEAGCGWTGLGTLGPVDKGPDGTQYVSSMTWIQGESSSSAMAYMHELGHNLYIHHANDSSGCEYCDYSSLMGGCCALRCFNAPNNWQLGWGQPLAVLNAATWPRHTWLYFDLPAQHTADAHMIWIQPDWLPEGRRDGVGGPGSGSGSGSAAAGATSFPVSYFISYRINSGRYDWDMPEEYLYATSIYFYDGATQTSVRRTRHLQAVFTGETYSNATEGWMLRQLSHGVMGGRVGLCRFSEVTEKSCGDGQDNDCDGLIDKQDPDCTQPSPPPAPPPAPRPPRPPPQAEPPGIMDDSPPGQDSPPPVKRRPPHPPSPPPPPSPPASPSPPSPPARSPPPSPKPPRPLPPSPPSPKPPAPSPPSPKPPSPPPPSPKPPSPPPSPPPPSPPPPSPPPPKLKPAPNTDIGGTGPEPNQASAKSPPPPPPVTPATGGGRKRPPPPAAGGGEIAPTKRAKKPPPPAATGGSTSGRKARPPPPSGAAADPSPPPPPPPAKKRNKRRLTFALDHEDDASLVDSEERDL